MCVVSAVHDYYQTRHPLPPMPAPLPWPLQPMPAQPAMGPIAGPWDRESLELLKRAVAILERLDAKLGDPDCVDPAKAEYVRELEHRIAGLEK